MQKFTLLLAFFGYTLTAFSQSPFTITENNFPVWGTQNYDGPNASGAYNPTIATNGNWNIAGFHSGSTATNFYVAETDPFYTSAGIDVYIDGFKHLTPNLGYIIYNELDFNSTGVYDKAIYVGPQAYSLSALTGNTLDSLTFPLQGAILSQGRQVMAFPATAQTAWSSVSHRVVDFNLTVTAAGLNKTPVKHDFTIFRTDTIIGWGKMRVYSDGVPSTPYDVLIDRSNQYAVDSFFIGGAPAPAALLSAFGMTQGQQTDISKRYTIFRQGYSNALVIFNYGSNNYTPPSQIFVDIDNLSTTGVENLVSATYSTLLFPNPSSSGAVQLQILGDIPALSSYSIADPLGRVVQQGVANLENATLTIQLNNSLPNGNYVLQVLGDQRQPLVAEQFMIAR